MIDETAQKLRASGGTERLRRQAQHLIDTLNQMDAAGFVGCFEQRAEMRKWAEAALADSPGVVTDAEMELGATRSNRQVGHSGGGSHESAKEHRSGGEEPTVRETSSRPSFSIPESAAPAPSSEAGARFHDASLSAARGIALSVEAIGGGAYYSIEKAAKIIEAELERTLAEMPPAVTVSTGALPGCTAQAIEESGKWAEMPPACNGPFGDEEQCPVHGEEIRRGRGRAEMPPARQGAPKRG